VIIANGWKESSARIRRKEPYSVGAIEPTGEHLATLEVAPNGAPCHRRVFVSIF